MSVKHQASRFEFDELYTNLLKEAEKRNVTRIRGQGEMEGLEIFDYTQSCQFDKQWNDYNIVARGLVVCPAEKRIVALPFAKFFNYGEISDSLPAMNFRATCKMDGSLGIAYFWKGQWRVNTRGSFTSPQSKWATKRLQEFASKLVPGNTYLFEIIYPENRVVIQYDFSALVLLGAYTAEGEEFEHEDLQVLGTETGMAVVKTFACTSLTELLQAVKDMDETEEGVVVRFENGYRVKIKGDKYVELHRMISDIRPLCIWESLLFKKPDNISKIPEEFVKDYTQIRNILAAREQAQLKELEDLAAKYQSLTDKEIGVQFVQIKKENPLGKFLFDYRKGKFLTDYERIDLTKSEPVTILRRSFFDMFRPDRNVLPGYTPSSSMNLFEEDV